VRRVANTDAADLDEKVDRSIAAHPSALFVDTDRWRHFPLLRFLVRIVQRTDAETATAPPGACLKRRRWRKWR